LRFTLPLLLLGASVGLYLGIVKPMAVRNRTQALRLASQVEAGRAFLSRSGVYPTETILSSLTSWEEKRRAALARCMEPPPGIDLPEQDLDALLASWGYSPRDPAYQSMKQFREQLHNLMAPGLETTGDRIAVALADQMCRARLVGFERLTCSLGKEEVFRAAGNLAALEVEMVFHSGSSEAVQFIEEWVLGTGGGFFIVPLQLNMNRLRSGKWIGNLKAYSSPPIQILFKTLIVYMIDKEL
jgi:hypothetical protein